MSIYSEITHKNEEIIAGRDDCDYTEQLLDTLNSKDRARFWEEVEYAEELVRERGVGVILAEDELERAFVEVGLEPAAEEAQPAEA